MSSVIDSLLLLLPLGLFMIAQLVHYFCATHADFRFSVRNALHHCFFSVVCLRLRYELIVIVQLMQLV